VLLLRPPQIVISHEFGRWTVGSLGEVTPHSDPNFHCRREVTLCRRSRAFFLESNRAEHKRQGAGYKSYANWPPREGQPRRDIRACARKRPPPIEGGNYRARRE